MIYSWAETLGIGQKKIATVESAGSLGDVLRGSELRFRELVHRDLNVPALDVIPVFVEVRNCLVHHRGHDAKNKVAELCTGNPSLGIILREGRVIITPEVAQSAVERFESDISIIDQVLGEILGVPRTVEPMPEFKRRY